MLKFLATKIAIAYAIYVARLHCIIIDKTQKLHVDYDVRGIAKVSAIQKVELERDSEEVIFVDSVTQHVTKCFDNGYYKMHGLIVTTEGEVDMESFRAIEHINGEMVVYNREEYQKHVGYSQDQARIVYPDGRVIVDAELVSQVIQGNQRISEIRPTNCPPIDKEGECESDITWALSAT